MLNSVVLIDDEDATNFLHKYVLKDSKMTHSVQSYCFPEIAISDIACGYIHPDLIFLDLDMPGMTGWEFLENLQALGERLTQALSVVIVSGSGDPNDQSKAQQYSVVKGFLRKPISVKNCQDIAQAILSR